MEKHTTFYELCDARRAQVESAARRLEKNQKQTIILLPIPVVFFIVFVSSNICLLIMWLVRCGKKRFAKYIYVDMAEPY